MRPDPAVLFAARAGRHERSFWLDGGGSRDWSGRRSVLGFLGPDDVSLTYDAGRRVVTSHASGRSEPVGDDIFSVLAEHVARDRGDPDVSWVGYLGYACRPDLAARPAGDVPDAVWMRVRDPLVVEHPVPAASGGGGPGGPASPVPPVPPGYAHAFAEVQEALHAGHSYEVNLTYRERLAPTRPVDPVTAYLRLRASNPAPYAGFLRHHGVALLSSSPERFATVTRDRHLETRPIKGTTPRGATAAEDGDRRRQLVTDPKLRAENLMIVDLLRNDLSQVCEPGSVTVPGLMEAESYPSVHQLVSTVRGRLREDVTTVAALRALFPAGSMTGAPKRRTMEVIDRVEATPRGVYAGAFGWLCADGRADLGVVIRSLVGTYGPTWSWSLGTGGGITVRSALAEEWAETRWKADRLRAVLTSP